RPGADHRGPFAGSRSGQGAGLRGSGALVQESAHPAARLRPGRLATGMLGDIQLIDAGARVAGHRAQRLGTARLPLGMDAREAPRCCPHRGASSAMVAYALAGSAAASRSRFADGAVPVSSSSGGVVGEFSTSSSSRPSERDTSTGTTICPATLVAVRIMSMIGLIE